VSIIVSNKVGKDPAHGLKKVGGLEEGVSNRGRKKKREVGEVDVKLMGCT